MIQQIASTFAVPNTPRTKFIGAKIKKMNRKVMMCRLRTSRLKEPALLSERREPARAREQAVFVLLCNTRQNDMMISALRVLRACSDM